MCSLLTPCLFNLLDGVQHVYPSLSVVNLGVNRPKFQIRNLRYQRKFHMVGDFDIHILSNEKTGYPSGFKSFHLSGKLCLQPHPSRRFSTSGFFCPGFVSVSVHSFVDSLGGVGLRVQTVGRTYRRFYSGKRESKKGTKDPGRYSLSIVNNNNNNN